MDEEEVRDLLASVWNEAAIATKADRAAISSSDYVFPQWKKCPITSQRQANSAAKLIAKVKKPDGSSLSDEEITAAKARAKRIMKRKGFAVPKAWQAATGGKKEAAFVMSDQMKMDAVQAALDAEDDPDMDGDNDKQPDDWRDYDHANARHLMPDGTVIFQMGWDGDWFSRPFTLDDDGEATLGMPCTRVLPQLTFEPAKDREMPDMEARTESVGGATGLICEAMESVRFEAIDRGDEGFTVSGTAIMPGINRSKTRIYPKETLAAALPLFKGAKMYVDHPTREDDRNGVRSFRDAAAVITDAWINGKNGIDYRASVFDPPTREKLSLMAKAGALDAMGVSVNYQGIGSPTTYEGYEVDNIESIDSLNSLDFVTEPGAWGSIDRFESVVADAIKRETARPVAKQERVFTVDEETRKLIESLKARLDESDKKLEASDKAREESDKRARVANTKVAVKQALEKSDLPQISQDRVLASYEGAESADDIEETIESERKFIESLKEELKAPKRAGRENVTPLRRRNGVVVGMGNTGRAAAKVTGTEDADEDEYEDAEMTEERGMQALEGFIPNPKQFAANMG